MPTPIELLEKKIRSREDVLRARRVEGLAREEEVEELKESLQKLQSTRKGIHKAIGDALSEGPAADPIAPTDLIEMAVEGCGKGSSDNNAVAATTRAKTFPDENMTAEDAVNLALLSMKQELGTVDFVEYIISAAVELSGLDGEDVVKAALDTVRSSNLKAEDVIMAALRSSRDSRFVHAPQIIGAAVQIALRRDIEAPVIVKEAFVKAVRGDHSLIKSSILSLLGCAVGMGMEYRDVKALVKSFSKEIKHGQMGQDGTSDYTKKVRFDVPSEAQSSSTAPAKQPQPSETTDAAGSNSANALVVKAFVDAALASINSGGPGMAAIGDLHVMQNSWPMEYAAACNAVEDILNRSTAAGESSKRSAGDEDEDEDEEQGRPSKMIKLDYRREDSQDKGQ